jgi:hypothetical protein
MKKYKVILGGRGSETYVFKLTPEQKQKLVDGEVEKDKMDVDEISEILEVGFITETDETYSGPYVANDSFVIEVYDEEDKKVWDSYDMEDDWDFDEESRWENEDGYESVADDENLLIVEDYCKGNYREFILEIEEDFQPIKLLPMVTEIGERVEIITGLFYDGKKMEDFEWGDTWSKGLYFYLT